MSRHLAREALGRMNLTETMVAPAMRDSAFADLRQLASVTDDTLEDAASERRLGQMMDRFGYRNAPLDKPFAFANGVAIIPIHGLLINRFHSSWGYVTGYNFIRAQMNAALQDTDVELIVFDVNSYGGEAAGCFELADEIRDARIQKSLLAVVDSSCCSAAYALASAADKLVVTPSGQAGSIGVIAMHMDMSQMLKDIGIKVTIIAEGDHKADGNPYEPLEADVLKEIRANVAKSYSKFVDLVVNNRAQLDSEAVRKTESRSYRADDALALKLIDAVQTPTEAVASFLAEMGSDDPAENEEEDMTTAAAPAAAPAADQTAITEAATAARVAERARVKGITECAEAKDKGKLASHLAMDTDMTVDAAKAILSAAAPEVAAAAAPVVAQEGAQEQQAGAGASPFKEAMDKGKHPEVGADAGSTEEKGPTRAQSAMALAFGAPKAKSAATTH